MKVIGDSKNEVVVTMSKDEAANLAGLRSAYNLQDQGKAMSPGCEFSISEMYQNAMDTLNFYRDMHEQFKKTQTAVNKLIGFIMPKENK